MKKIFFFVAIAALALTACQKSETVSVSNDQAEITAVGFNKVMTKGYTGWKNLYTAFEEVANPEDNEEDPTVRKMHLSVYEQNVGDLFTDEEFTKGGDDVWHADPPKYYPLGGNTFEFLAYSVGKEANYVGVWDGAKKVSLQVTDEFFQDDILYAAESNASKTAYTVMTFQHAQAWINMNFNLTATSADDINFHINSVTWKNVKSQGMLYIESKKVVVSEAEMTVAYATWDFFGIDSNEVVMNDAQNVLYGTGIYLQKETTGGSANPNYIKTNMLLPAQSGASGFVINYTIGSQTFDYEYNLSSAANWQMGKKYVYNVHITINEITVAPEVQVFVDGSTEEIGF